MWRQRAYYLLKPILPWGLRIAMRRILARWQRNFHHGVWPINYDAGDKPNGWPGWPNENKIAVVLTHDVEGPEGLAKCIQLAQFEMALGFRSSFNFIPEGPYSVSPEIRIWLTKNGFEVGVHDLQHDGKLFSTRRSFNSKAVNINRHLRNWQAVGFRSGFMLRNLEWLHGLDIHYDSSTFDTDPFEIQPNGANTIFPFWIPSPSRPPNSSSPLVEIGSTVTSRARGGYVELPYTLPQDSTLFLVLREKSPAIWLHKLDWIASRGGMVLVNVHPDYVRFKHERPSARTFDIQFYADLLHYIRSKYSGTYWNALPKDIAFHVRNSAFRT